MKARRRHHQNRGESVVEVEANLRDQTYVGSRSSIRERFGARSERAKKKEILRRMKKKGNESNENKTLG